MFFVVVVVVFCFCFEKGVYNKLCETAVGDRSETLQMQMKIIQNEARNWC